MTGHGLLLGVDGGNTKTLALVATADGTIIGTGRARRGSDIHAVPVDTAVGVLDAVVAAALEMAGGRPARAGIGAAAYSLAGADWPEDTELLTARLTPAWPVARVVNDAIGALRAAIPDGPGVVVVCGTGTATGARGPDGSTWHSSFWQEPQGAYELGVRARQAVLRAALGIDPPTALTDLVLAATGEADVEALLHHATGREVPDRRDAAELAPVLLDAADALEPTALRIVEAHGRALGLTAVAAARRVGIDLTSPFPVALAGGLFRHPAVRLRRALYEAVGSVAPGAVERPGAAPPVLGAVLLAFDLAGITVTPTIEARLRATLPDPGWFDGGAA